MSIEYVEAIVQQPIPRACIADIELILLRHYFNKADIDENRVWFSACQSLNDCFEGEISFDGEFRQALEASEQICPYLYDELKDKSANNLRIIGAVEWRRIFQDILRRNPSDVRYISILEKHRDTKHCPDLGETYTVITANSIQHVVTDNIFRNPTSVSETIQVENYIYILEENPTDCASIFRLMKDNQFGKQDDATEVVEDIQLMKSPDDASGSKKCEAFP